MELQDFGRVWMASSAFTDNFRTIRRCIDAGVDTIVTKSITSGIEPFSKRIGKRKVRRYVIGDPFLKYFTPDIHHDEDTGEVSVGRTVFTTSTAKDVEALTVEEANRLYDQVKEYSPGTSVVQSFAPASLEDFDLLPQIKADAIEFNSRWYKMKVRKPIAVLLEHLDPRLDYSGIIPRDEFEEISLEFVREKKRKMYEIESGLSSLNLEFPLLFKVTRDLYELDWSWQFGLPVDGFTFSDSTKSGIITQRNDRQVQFWGKGSIAGERLSFETKVRVESIRSQNTNTYLSASGGIMSAEDAIDCLDRGADSVQLCSMVYFHGYDEIARTVEVVNAH